MEPSQVLAALKAPKNLPFVALLLFVDGLALAAGGGVVGGGLAFLATLGGIALGVYVAGGPSPAGPAIQAEAIGGGPVVDLYGRLYEMRDRVWDIIPREEGKTIGPDAVGYVSEQLQALKGDAAGKLNGVLSTQFDAAMRLLVEAAMSDDPDVAEAKVAQFDQRTPTLPEFLAMAR